MLAKCFAHECSTRIMKLTNEVLPSSVEPLVLFSYECRMSDEAETAWLEGNVR